MKRDRQFDAQLWSLGAALALIVVGTIVFGVSNRTHTVGPLPTLTTSSDRTVRDAAPFPDPRPPVTETTGSGAFHEETNR